jgi:hypothetical protein
VLIFASLAVKESISSLPSGVVLGVPITSLDGRVACVHGFSEEDLAFALTFDGVSVASRLPDDWQYPQEITND